MQYNCWRLNGKHLTRVLGALGLRGLAEFRLAAGANSVRPMHCRLGERDGGRNCWQWCC